MLIRVNPRILFLGISRPSVIPFREPTLVSLSSSKYSCQHNIYFLSRVFFMASSIAINKPSRTQTLYGQLRVDVISCRLLPGERLNIAELAGKHDVSPGAVREALSRLTAENLVTAEARRGFRVSPISKADLEDLTDIRVGIESQCLRRAITNASIEWESNLVAVSHTLSRMPERAAPTDNHVSDEWAAAHHAFHETLVSTCDSRWLLRVRDRLYAHSERYRRLSIPLAESKRDIRAEHQAILEAAINRDADKAVQLLTDHIRRTTLIISETE